MLTFENVSFAYNNTAPVLENVSFKIEAGSFVSLVGASGSGKSTVFRLINNLEKPSSGKIKLNNKDLNEYEHIAGYMPQQDLLFPWRTIKKNVMLPMEIKTIPKAEAEKAAARMLEITGLSGWEDKYPKELSGGMRQRVSFARALCTGADLLLLDEPFSALDAITRKKLQEWIREQWNALKKTILLITHDVDEAVFLSDKILLLTGNPVTSIREFEVPLPKERERKMMQEEEALRLKETLLNILGDEAVHES